MKTISTQKNAESRIKDTEILHEISNNNLNQLQNIFQNAPAAIAIFNGPQHKFVMANHAYQKQKNRTEKELLGKTYQEVFPELDGTGIYEIFANVYSTGKTFAASEYEAMIDLENNGNQTKRYFNFSLEPLKTEKEEIYGLLVMALDITEQVLARKKIEENEHRFQKLVNQAPVAMSILRGNNFLFEMANEKHLQLLGKTKEQIMNFPAFEAIPESIEQGYESIFENVYKTGIPFVADELPLTIIRNDKKETIYLNFINEPLYNIDNVVDGIFSIAIDVTEQVKARKKIEESEQRFQAAVAAVQGVVWTNNAKGEMEGEQLGWGELSGQNYEEYQGYGWANAIHPDDVQDSLAAWNEAVSKCKHFVFEHRVKMKNEKWGHFSVKAIPLLNEDGTIREWVGVHTDITEQKNALQKIEETEHKYHNLIYTSPYMIAIFKGKNLIIEIANDAILETWGKGKNVIGKSFYEVLPEAVEQGFDKLILNVFETGEPYHAYETPITLWRNNKWELMHYNFIYQAQRNVQGEIEGVAILANEVSPQVQDKMKIIESEERFRLLADNLPLNIFVADASLEDNITYVNKYWLDFTQQTFDVATNNGWFWTIHPDDKHLVMSVYEPAFKNREPYTIPNFRLKRFDGAYRWFTFIANPRYLPNGEYEGYMGVGFDITDQKLFEQELIDEKIKAENAAKSKQQFLSNMSHEIRTPLNSILGFTNVLLKTDLAKQQNEYVQAIKTSGKSLNLLINDILDLAKVDSGKMTFEKEPFDLRKTISSILHSFDLKIKEKNLELIKEFDNKIPKMLLGDSLRLNQIFLNLLSNAVKFTHKGKISINVNLKQDNEDNVIIEFAVSDSGIGIDDNKINAIFQPFEQAETSTSNSYGGTGLGLAIVKQLIEFQGGYINLTSKIDEGSTFTFTLPFGKTKANYEHNVEEQSQYSEVKKLRILVAEDVLLNQLLIKIILDDFGFEHDVVNNGKIATEKMQTNTYDIILMDMQMPEMNGIEATEYIRKTLKSTIPIIALTADVTTVDLNKCKEFGMDDYISKPIDEKLLYKKIVEMVNNKL